MNMGMQVELLIPRVQHTEKTNFRPKVSRIPRDLKKGFGAGAEQQAIDELFVLQCQACQLRGKCKDYVDVARREKFLLTRGDPAVPGSGLTLRAVAIAAAVIRDGGTMPAAGALIDMAAECGGTTSRNGQQHFDVLPADPLAISFDKSSSCAADEIAHLQGRPTHLPFLRWLVFELQRVQRTRCCAQVTFGEMEVNGRLFQTGMA